MSFPCRFYFPRASTEVPARMESLALRTTMSPGCRSPNTSRFPVHSHTGLNVNPFCLSLTNPNHERPLQVGGDR